MAQGKKCAVQGCDKILNKTAGRICQKHRTRLHRHGNYNTISEKWPNLKKGKPCITKYGYLRVNIGGKRILQHRYVMEQHLNRKLTRNETIHHINGNKTDNRIENLELFGTGSMHRKTHHRYSWETRKKRPRYSADTIKNILDRLNAPSSGRGRKPIFPLCFCGLKYMARNLCAKHFAWAYKHKFI